jgi:hypothetical protein
MGSNQPSGSAFAANDAQFGIVKVLKPFPNFEDVYQGKDRSTPIAFPGTLDAQANRPGYAPNLLAGTPVPLGARVVLWIPVCIAEPVVQDVDYFFIWRLRNIRDFRDPGPNSQRAPFHFPRQSPGAPDSTIPAPRFVLPASCQQLVFDPVFPASDLPAVSVSKRNWLRIGNGSAGSVDALTPSGVPGIVQQGVLDPAFGPQAAGDPLFVPYSTYAQGDELIIFAMPQPAPPGAMYNFDLAAADFPFSNVYGKGGTGAATHPSYPDVGIYLMVGTPGPDTQPRRPTP